MLLTTHESDKASICSQICFATIVLGWHEMYVAGRVQAHMVLPMLWAAYNATPACIFFIYLFASPRTLEIVCFFAHYLSSGCAIGAMICLWFADTTNGGGRVSG